MKNKLLFAVALPVLGLLIGASTASAQRDAGSKIRGDMYNFDSGGAYQSHAYDHAQILNQYSETGQPVPKAVIQEQTQAIRTNVEGARRAYSNLSDATKNDTAAAKHLAEIESHHAKALKTCDMLDAQCAKAEGDSATVCACCADVQKELKAAESAHDKLTKHLNMDKPAPVAKK
jgi:hypothetical protein